ncbi:MAG TPA: hypothetical protein VFP80_11335 [Thermoanaerobaculia bacterium]|nr:hypothetical protein [Thermoanaerobaculia bacterium]
MSDAYPSFGDFIRAFARVRPKGPAAKRALANLFGLDYAEGAAPREPEPEPEVEDPERPRTPQPAGPAEPPRAAPAVKSHEILGTDVVPAFLRPLANETQPPRWGLVKPLELPPAATREPPPLEPLLVPRWTRGILSAALTRRLAEGDIDVEAVVDTISDGRPFRAVPRRLVSRSGGAVQVLVDASDAMTPFAEDARWLTGRIEATAGHDRTETLGIEYAKTFVAGRGSRLRWTDYFRDHAPLPGVVVILLSDLGIGRAPLARWASPERWLAFAEGLHKRGAGLIALVPYARDRWPVELKRAIPIVYWDARTTARSARRALETRLRQHRRPRP